MTVLTQQATGKVMGRMRVGRQEVQSSFGRNIGFCQQMDIHEHTSTVREAFEFSALLRQGSKVPRADKMAYVDKIIGILGMNELQHSVIRSLSPEQKKRTTIGVELCARPSFLLFLDEPTSVGGPGFTHARPRALACRCVETQADPKTGTRQSRRHQHCPNAEALGGRGPSHHLHHPPGQPGTVRAGGQRRSRLFTWAIC